MHRIVAAAFLDTPTDNNCWQVNHLDGDPGNNHLSNLEYATPSDNARHAWATNAARMPGAARLTKGVRLRPCGEKEWRYCASQQEAAKLLGISESTVSNCCRGVRNRCRAKGAWHELESMSGDELQSPPGVRAGEVWRAAIYPGEREAIPNLTVSSHGRVAQALHSCCRSSYGSLKPNGYYVVGRAGRMLYVHRLVAATFLGQPELADMQVNHKDHDRSNNHVKNLEYVTPSQNSQHAALQKATVGTKASRNGKAVQARARGCERPWLEFASVKAAATHTGVAADRISKICKGSTKASDCWEFRLASDELLLDEEWRPVVLDRVRAYKRQ